MSTKNNGRKVALINAYDVKGGASIGTFRLFKALQYYTHCIPSLFVVSCLSSDNKGVFSLSLFPRLLYLLQLLVNRSLCLFLSNQTLPVAFSFLSFVSIPALLICLKTLSYKRFYFHSMGVLACPTSFFLFLKKATVIKTADDWYLTGGCHYSLSCNQWISGCHSCPYMNPVGKFVVRLNWYLKRKMLSSASFKFVSPSLWLTDRYSLRFPGRCVTIYNSVFGGSSLTSDDNRKYPMLHNREVISLGLPVTYLRDLRKGFLQALPVLHNVLEKYSVQLILCGGDSCEFFTRLLSLGDKQKLNSSVFDMGRLSTHEMPDFYERIDFLLHFSSYDNSPNVITEAFAHGVPAIVLDRAGSPEHVYASGAGFVLDHITDLDSIISSVSRDNSVIKSMKQKAFDYSRRVLSPEKMAKSYASLLCENSL